MKKSIFWALVASFAACVAHAEVVTPAMARAAADAWAARNAEFDTGSGATNVITVCDTNAAHTILWHQVSMAGGGCVIIAPATEIEPVVAALDNDPGELPAAHPLRAILKKDMRNRLRFLKLYEEDPPKGGGLRLRGTSASGAQSTEEESENVATVRQEWAEQQKKKWNGLLVPQRKGGGRRLAVSQSEGVANDDDMPIKVVVKGFEKDGPLTHWNQQEAPNGDYCYNYYTPNHAPCGCVATAMSAMMQFFGTAATEETKVEGGKANSSCTYNYGPVPGEAATIGGVYDWSKFSACTSLADYHSLSDAQCEILGRVAYDAGVALGMQWGDGGSGTQESATATALRDWFGFHEARCVNNPRPDQFPKLIYAQNRAHAPVGLGISDPGRPSGHSVLAVGYGKDKDGVERVRVFAGWGGAGDAWYALPYIDTASVPGGASYLFSNIDCVITMVGYQDDNVVPVCGQLLPYMNANMTIGGIATEANENGLFGARVSASETQNKQVEVVCTSGSKTKTGSVLIGSDPGRDSSYTSSGDGICKWVPDPILFPLLNSEVALSFADAREKSIASITNGTPKPVLAFSGDWSEQPTIAAWDYLSWLDDGKDDGDFDFTNKYVVLCTPFSISNLSESDGDPSVGIFDGRAISVEPNKIWSFYNGRLAYWSIGGSIYTNVENQAESDIREFYVTNGVDGARCVVTNSLEELEQAGVLEDAEFEYVGNVPARYITGHGITNAVINVLENGLTNFLVRAADISVTIASDCTEKLNVGPDPGYGTHMMSNGVSFVATAPAFATNAAGNVEYKCVGYIYYTTNKTDGTTFVTTVENTTATDEIVTVRNNDYTITWMWEPYAVKIITESVDEDNTYCTVVPATGWFPIHTRVTFKANPPPRLDGYDAYFGNWVVVPNGGQNQGDGDMYSEFGDEMTVYVTRPITIRAQFDRDNKLPDWGSFNLTITNACLNPEDAPRLPSTYTESELYMEVARVMNGIINGSSLTNGAITADTALKTRLDGTELEYDTPITIQKLGIKPVKLDAGSATGSDGESYMCCGWLVTRVKDGKEELLDMEYSLRENAFTVDGSALKLNNSLQPKVSGVRTGDTDRYEYKYEVKDGDSLTLMWIWTRGTSDDDTDDAPTEFDIQWEDDGSGNLRINNQTNLMTVAQMDSMGWNINTIEEHIHVTTPTGWTYSVSASGGQVVAKLIRDDDALTASMEKCDLTVYSNANGTYTVEATIEKALRGFWYVLYGSDDLVTWDVVTSGTYESGTSAAQGQGTAKNPISEVNLSIIVTPGSTGAGVKRFYKVVSGATSTPLTTY